MNIKKIQSQLNVCNTGVLAGVGRLEEDGILGKNTTAAIKYFQQTHGIKPDGMAGAATLAALFPSETKIIPVSALRPIKGASLKLAIRAMEIAVSQNGVREATGNNDGAAVETFLSSTGLGKGYAWCMAFVYWCYQQASIQLGVINPLFRTAGCLRQWNEMSPKGTNHKTNPQVGDIFIMDLGKGAGHTGIVTKVHNDGTFDTVEGNTNTNGSANGDGVYLRTRQPRTNMKGFIRC